MPLLRMKVLGGAHGSMSPGTVGRATHSNQCACQRMQAVHLLLERAAARQKRPLQPAGRHGATAAAPHLTLHPHVSAHQVRQAAGDGQSQACATIPPRHAGVALQQRAAEGARLSSAGSLVRMIGYEQAGAPTKQTGTHTPPQLPSLL